MHIFYTPDIKGNTYILSPEESSHCIRVLRLKIGDPIILADGRGSHYQAILKIANPKACLLDIISSENGGTGRPYHLTIAIAPTKMNDRFEWFLEKSTEIGIDRIVPIICNRSERRDLKKERMEKILIAAMKQSGQLFLPELSEPVKLKTFLDASIDGQKFIAHCDKDDKKELGEVLERGSKVVILIGPEGDFDPEEIKLAKQSGYLPVSLGNTRLRTETAGLVACHSVCFVNQ